MTKIHSLSGQQRLLQLARNQFGSGVMPADSATGNNTNQQQGHFADKHQQLAARSGATAGQAGLTLAQRAERRLQMQRERQQHNLERVMALALEYCPEHVSAQDIDPDWFQQFCELILDISNHSMQQLWAKILAGEIASPGKFSLKTLHTLKRMSYKEAMALQQAANLSCRPRQDPAVPVGFCHHERHQLATAHQRQTRRHIAATVQLRVVEHALPAYRGTRLLKVHTHNHLEVIAMKLTQRF